MFEKFLCKINNTVTIEIRDILRRTDFDAIMRQERRYWRRSDINVHFWD